MYLHRRNLIIDNKIIKLNRKYKQRIDWNQYFMSIALLASVRSSCDRLHVGCVLTKNNRIISTGYNGFLKGFPHKSIVRNNHEQATVHAEQNAITDGAQRSVDSYLDRLFYVFKQGGKTDLEIGIGTKEGNFTWYTKYNFKKNKTYLIKIHITNKDARTFVGDKLINHETISGKRSIYRNCDLFLSDKFYSPARCKIESLLISSSGSDMKWVRKFMGKCGENPTTIGGELLHNEISELLRYDIADKSQSVEWQLIGQEQKKTDTIPQPNPLRKLSSEYIPLIDDDNREWIPDHIDIANNNPTNNIHLGKYFSKKVSNLRGFKLPDIYQSEYELIGGLVSRAESSKRRGASENEMLKHKEKIVKIFDELMGFETDSYTNINNKKREKQYSGVPAYTQPDQSVKQQTNNMFNDNANAKNKVGRYTNKYRPRDPREYPRPVDSMWNFLSN